MFTNRTTNILTLFPNVEVRPANEVIYKKYYFYFGYKFLLRLHTYLKHSYTECSSKVVSGLCQPGGAKNHGACVSRAQQQLE